MGRRELADKVLKALDLAEHHNNRVESAFEALQSAGKISLPLGGNIALLIALESCETFRSDAIATAFGKNPKAIKAT